MEGAFVLEVAGLWEAVLKESEAPRTKYEGDTWLSSEVV